MNNCEYVVEYYGVPACMGRRIMFRGKRGSIIEDRGNYIGVNFDKDKLGVIFNVHPTDDVEYFDVEPIRIRKMTRAQKRYQKYLDVAECYDSFAGFLGIREK